MVDLRGQVVLAARIEIAAHHWHRPNVTEAQQMSQLGQSRRFGPPPMTSGLPRKRTPSRTVGMSQKCQELPWLLPEVA